MADDVTLPANSGTFIAASDDVGAGRQVQLVKIALGADGALDYMLDGGVQAGAASLPVALSTEDNAVLDTIDTALDAINAKLVTGTVIGDVNLGATDNAVLDSIATNTDATHTDVGTIAGAVAGGHMQADIVGALPAGSALLGKVGIDQTTPGTTNKVAIGTDGTVTANLGATDNAVLDDIAAKVAGAYGKTRLGIRVALAASQTGTTVWDPTAGKKFVLTKIVVSCATAGTLQFFDHTDTAGSLAIGPILTFTAAGSGWSESWPLDWPYVSATADNILKYTSSAGFTGSVYVEGWEV